MIIYKPYGDKMPNFKILVTVVSHLEFEPTVLTWFGQEHASKNVIEGVCSVGHICSALMAYRGS